MDLMETKEEWSEWLESKNLYGWYHRIQDPIESEVLPQLYYITEHPAIILDKVVTEENLYEMILDWVSTHKEFESLNMTPCKRYTSIYSVSLLFTLITDFLIKPYRNEENRLSSYFIYRDLHLTMDCFGGDNMYYYIKEVKNVSGACLEEDCKLK
jgi:hypothetical protein